MGVSTIVEGTLGSILPSVVSIVFPFVTIVEGSLGSILPSVVSILFPFVISELGSLGSILPSVVSDTSLPFVTLESSFCVVENGFRVSATPFAVSITDRIIAFGISISFIASVIIRIFSFTSGSFSGYFLKYSKYTSLAIIPPCIPATKNGPAYGINEAAALPIWANIPFVSPCLYLSIASSNENPAPIYGIAFLAIAIDFCVICLFIRFFITSFSTLPEFCDVSGVIMNLLVSGVIMNLLVAGIF